MVRYNLLICFLGVLQLFVTGAWAKKDASLWMCLERCDANVDIQERLASIEKNRASLTRVSFEDWDLGPNSTLIYNKFAEVNGPIQKMGLGSFPMITTVDHLYLYQLFENPQPFINSAVSAAVKYNYNGFNIDWEPSGAMLPGTPQKYASFLDQFAKELHKEGKKLTVDVALWNPYFWNNTLIAQTAVDRLITMETYCCSDNFESWKGYLDRALSAIPAHKLGVGLYTGKIPMSPSQLQERINYIKAQGNISEIAVWQMPLPAAYWAALRSWLE